MLSISETNLKVLLESKSHLSISLNNLPDRIEKSFQLKEFYDSLWLYRIRNILDRFKIEEDIHFYDFIVKLLDFREWAESNAYGLHEIELPMLYQDHQWMASFPEHLRNLYKQNEFLYKGKTFLCEASDCIVAKWVFAPYDEHFEVFSKNLDLLYREHHKPYLKLIQKVCHIREVTDDFSHALVDFSYFKPNVIEIDDPCILVGSQQNYGHWFTEYLSKFYLIEKFDSLKQLPFVFGRLNQFQKEALAMTGIDEQKIFQLPRGQSETELTLYKFKKLYIPTDVPLEVGRYYLRQKFKPYFSEKKPYRCLYLSRSKTEEKERVSNEEEVTKFLINKGFEIIYPEELTIKETVLLFSEAKIVISSLGSQAMNIAFTENCPLIILFGKEFLEVRNFSWNVVLTRLFLPLCDYVIPVAGHTEVKKDSLIDNLCHFDLNDIESAIIQAEKVLSHNKNINPNINTDVTNVNKLITEALQIQSAENINKKGEELYNRKDSEGAIASFSKALEIEPNYILAHNNLGVQYWKNGEVSKALKHFKKALQIDSNNRDIILNCAGIFKDLGKIEDAKKLYTSYLQHTPSDPLITQALFHLTSNPKSC